MSRPTWQEITAAQIDALDEADPEVAHGMADDLLLESVDPIIAEAYRRLVDRCHFWATA